MYSKFKNMFWNKHKIDVQLKRMLSGFSENQTVESPLSGIRVLDMTRILAGPFCTMILGDLGAEIIKVENPDGGDETRNWGPPFVNGESTYFLSINRNKKSISIDMKLPKGRDLIKELAVKSDVLVENFVPGKLSTFGLDYESLHKVAPHLVYCSITGYGSSGPYSTRPGYDVIAASVGGLLHITGPEDGEPCKVGVAMTDLSTGLYAHGAIMAALLQRLKTGKGQKIECDLLSTQVSLLVNISSNYLNGKKEAKRWGTAHESIVPYQAFKTKDGFITVGAGSNKQFKILCEILNIQHFLTDSKYLSNKERVENRKVLISELTNIFSQKTTQHWMNMLEESGIPYGPVNNMEQVFNDPQVLHNKMILDMIHPTAGNIKVTGPAVKYSDSVNEGRLPPPIFAEHTDVILSKILSYSENEIQSLRKSKVVL
ncbi:succinate--hydroxymethylglutarate CoA-transferase-like [Argiope bruennichi]|uniref:Succinyl-CoA:glutarate CoA-transferase n=1 Tax=Argiope bruennichi TaxID=94029 RepID=A0A8T0FFR3_ARGBR|nr:succinate--hydroxymethylglutarate CoA-transferase-like [Argiope bruennichi]KAF8789202.1 Succinate--hydroxymethylglutarate like protein [Argiope bruennichi]